MTTTLWLQNRGSESEISSYLDNIWELAFIGEPFDYEVDQNVNFSRLGDVLMNLDVIKGKDFHLFFQSRLSSLFLFLIIFLVANLAALLEIFEQSSSIFIQRLILSKLRKSFQQDSTNYSRSKSVKLFKYLFQKFHQLDQEIQWTILDLLSSVALDGHRLGDEFQLYCSLLEGTSPRSVLIVVHHMIGQILKAPVCRDYFHAAGLMSTLSDFLNYLPHQHPFYDALFDDPKER